MGVYLCWYFEVIAVSVRGEVYYDVCLLSESYCSLDDDELFTEHRYSLLNVGHLSEQKIDTLIDKLVEGFTDFSSYDSCRSIRVRYGYIMYDDDELTYLAVCGQCPKQGHDNVRLEGPTVGVEGVQQFCPTQGHDNVRLEVRAKVREIAEGSSVIYMEKHVNLSTSRKPVLSKI